ncbi:hypothetical protein EWM64_g1382 [Hericium alpestre]|uniref:NADP-dependent oxidoreductase domain-containing protein n=1 Tax=Hericium alpestre TaxID=135208 RepID=A0A4Z0A6I1_9AGAM|nr:hypothetical protein EWM64_g1382 [Hericium alpestre]
MEAELIPAVRQLGLRLVTFNPLAGGFFSGKALLEPEALDKSDPFHPYNGWLGPVLRERYLKNGQLEALKLLQEVAMSLDKNNLTLAEIGYRWNQHHSLLQPGDGVVFGASNIAHLEQNIANAEKGPLSKDIVTAVDLAQKIVGLDAPFYA